MADKPPDGGKSVLFHVTLHPVNPFLLYEKIKPPHNRMVQIYTYFTHIQAGSKKIKPVGFRTTGCPYAAWHISFTAGCFTLLSEKPESFKKMTVKRLFNAGTFLRGSARLHAAGPGSISSPTPQSAKFNQPKVTHL